MIEFVISFMLSCPNTIIINKTSEWTTRDKEEMAKAEKVCKREYVNSPCLKKFIKKQHLTYWAICGAKGE